MSNRPMDGIKITKEAYGHLCDLLCIFIAHTDLNTDIGQEARDDFEKFVNETREANPELTEDENDERQETTTGTDR